MVVLKRTSAEGAGSPGIIGFGIGSGAGDRDCRIGEELIFSGVGDIRGGCVGDLRGGEYRGGESYASKLNGDHPHLSRQACTRSYDRARSTVSLRPSPVTSRTMRIADSNSALVLVGRCWADGGDSGGSEANGSNSGPGISALTRWLRLFPRKKSI